MRWQCRDRAPRNMAEALIDLGESIKYPIGKILLANDVTMEEVARAKLALDFINKGPAFTLRACVEDWDLNRIAREVH